MSEENKTKLAPWQVAIKSYLDNRAKEDELFAKSYAKENKNIEECCRYILSEARKRGQSVCMTDDEVFGLAVHYYDEDEIKVEKSVGNYRASTSTPAVELTEEEKAAARERAVQSYERQCIEEKRRAEEEKARKEKERQKARLEELKKKEAEQPTLFTFD